MRTKVAYLLGFVLAVFLAFATHLSLASSAQQNSGGHPTPECEECAQACRIEFEACKAAGRPFGQCAREQQQCGAACRKPGGACNPQTGSTPKKK